MVTRETQGLESWFSWQQFLGFSEFRDKISQTTQNAAKNFNNVKKIEGKNIKVIWNVGNKNEEDFQFFFTSVTIYKPLYEFSRLVWKNH